MFTIKFLFIVAVIILGSVFVAVLGKYIGDHVGDHVSVIVVAIGVLVLLAVSDLLRVWLRYS